MFTALASLLLLSVHALRADAQDRTYRTTDPSTGGPLECERCPPGAYLRQGCTSTRRSQCAPCPRGTFTELWNHLPKCLRCGACGRNQVEKTACAPDADCACQCAEGFYYRRSYDMCVQHSRCPAGEGVQLQGSPDNDTVCQVCPSGSFSDSVSAHHTCELHKSCDAPGLKLLLKGSAWHDSVCADGRLQSADGAEYLKEILPAFFLHHNLSEKRLRRILTKLPGDKHTDSGLSVSARINAWVASATGNQIRQLPDILNKAGVDHSGERLHNKLQRIDSNLKELSSLRNEVGV